jgi:hypothetical protein
MYGILLALVLVAFGVLIFVFGILPRLEQNAKDEAQQIFARDIWIVHGVEMDIRGQYVTLVLNADFLSEDRTYATVESGHPDFDEIRQLRQFDKVSLDLMEEREPGLSRSDPWAYLRLRRLTREASAQGE